jgi:pimeloyl-ACP methyl ester carboxylesterase
VDAEQVESYDLRYGEAGAIHEAEDGESLYYELRGEGPVVTFVSTIYVMSTAWRNFTTELVRSNCILTYDLRNQGASSEAPAPFAQHVRDLAHLLDALEIEQTYLVGTSISTLICRDFAIADPQRVKGLVLAGPSISPWGAGRRKRIVRSWLTTLESGGPEALFDLIYPIVFGDKMIAEGRGAVYLALRERFLAINSKAQLAENLQSSLEASDDPGLLDAVEAPALLMVGDDDFTASRGAMLAMLGLIGKGRLDVLSECGHLPYFEATDRFERSVQEFITAVETDSIEAGPRERLL